MEKYFSNKLICPVIFKVKSLNSISKSLSLFTFSLEDFESISLNNLLSISCKSIKLLSKNGSFIEIFIYIINFLLH